MFTNFFFELRDAGIPATLKEYLTLMEALDKGCASMKVDDFYYLSRATFVKDEKHLDKFDRVFGHAFKGLEFVAEDGTAEVPEEWLRQLAELYLSEDEIKKIEAMGSWEEVLETLKKRFEEQDERHEGGNKWIGTAGTSPFGAYGYNPMGVRIGQKEGRHGKAIKVWDKREFRNLDDSVELGTRNIKVALKRLRRWAREGAEEELDLPGTIRATAEHGYLDVITRPERHNAVKVLLFLDVGGSMDPFVRVVEELFSAARTEFKHLEYYYFHNCLYEGVWRDNRRRWDQQIPTWEVLRTYGSDYKCLFVGDASMSPYEIAYPGGANEHWNTETGQTWLTRTREHWPHNVWLNPLPEKHWQYTQSVGMIREIFAGAMYPLTLEGIGRAMKAL